MGRFVARAWALAVLLLCWPLLGPPRPRRRTSSCCSWTTRPPRTWPACRPCASSRARAPPSTTPTRPRRCARRPAPSSRPGSTARTTGSPRTAPAVRGQRRPRPHLRLGLHAAGVDTGFVGKYINGAPAAVPGWDSFIVHLETGRRRAPRLLRLHPAGSTARRSPTATPRATTRSTSSAASPCGTSRPPCGAPAVPHHARRGGAAQPADARAPLRPRAGHARARGRCWPSTTRSPRSSAC